MHYESVMQLSAKKNQMCESVQGPNHGKSSQKMPASNQRIEYSVKLLAYMDSNNMWLVLIRTKMEIFSVSVNSKDSVRLKHHIEWIQSVKDFNLI